VLEADIIYSYISSLLCALTALVSVWTTSNLTQSTTVLLARTLLLCTSAPQPRMLGIAVLPWILGHSKQVHMDKCLQVTSLRSIRPDPPRMPTRRIQSPLPSSASRSSITMRWARQVRWRTLMHRSLTLVSWICGIRIDRFSPFIAEGSFGRKTPRQRSTHETYGDPYYRQ
jgi:hypothetical protein